MRAPGVKRKGRRARVRGAGKCGTVQMSARRGTGASTKQSVRGEPGAEDAVVMSRQYGAKTATEWLTVAGSAERRRHATILRNVMEGGGRQREQKTQENFEMHFERCSQFVG